MTSRDWDPALDAWYEGTSARDRWVTTVVVVLFVLLTGLGIAMAAGLVFPRVVFADPSGQFPDGGVFTDLFVPAHIYLFSFLGALAHVFIVMFLNPVYYDPSLFRYQLTAASVRIPLAVLLSTGLYLLTALFGFDFPGRTLAGVSFLVGLYVREMVMALVAVVQRLFTVEGVDLERFYFGWRDGDRVDEQHREQEDWDGEQEDWDGEQEDAREADENRNAASDPGSGGNRDGGRTLACTRCGSEETPRTLVGDRVVCADCLTAAERAGVASDFLDGGDGADGPRFSSD